jgi:uncharacterized protein (TIGR03083 family)
MVATCHQLGLERTLETLAAEVERLAAIVEGDDLVAAVPTCPPWTLRDLLEHIGGVHRWAAAHVRLLSPRRIPSGEMDLGIPTEAKEFSDWLRAGRDVLTETFRNADPDASMWAWGADKHARFWPRRMLHETAVHRADAELALGIRPEIRADVAYDGVDEFLDNLPHAEYFAPNVVKLRGDGETVALRAPGAEWLVTLQPDAFTWSHETTVNPSATVEASPEDLLLFVYGRRKPGDRVSASGSDEVLGRWIANSTL